jgi:serine kinase of HPr protein (carbohydrate metabolism regulator)
MTLIHATCVAIGEAGVALRGPSGAGKSDLALRLIDDGAVLVADDYCEVTAGDGLLRAAPPAVLAGKVEIRGYGIVGLPHRASATLKLVVDLLPQNDIERMPDTPTTIIDGITLPCLAVDPFTASAAAKVRLVLKAVS